MTSTRNRQLTTLSLVVGAVLFGMVLAGGLELTVPGMSDPQVSLSATQIAATSSASRSLPSFADLATAVDPAVVSIQAATIGKAPANRRSPGGPGGPGGQDPFEFFFGPRDRGDQGQGQGQGGRDFRQDAGGSGFVISRDGLVVTNYHVVEGATNVRVHLGDRDYPAEVKGSDPATDIALLKIDAGRDLRYLELGDSDQTRVGDWVMVVGNPLNLDKTVTTGVISAKGRALGISDISFENFIQTDAAINFGNSGGPLINLNGQVVAIATAINWGAENIGFAVPVNTLKEVLPQLREKGKVSRGYLGIQIQNLDYETAQAFGLQGTDGALVGSVEDDTPAAEAGVQHGDVITGVDGRKVRTTRDLIDYVSAKGPNARVTLQILRDGKPIERQIRLGERPPLEQQAAAEEPEGGSGIDWLGLQYQDLTGNLRQQHGITGSVDGVWVTDVGANSPLYEERVRPGDVITEVNGKPVHSVRDFEKAVGDAKSGAFLRFYVLRFGQNGQSTPFFAVVRVP